MLARLQRVVLILSTFCTGWSAAQTNPEAVAKPSPGDESLWNWARGHAQTLRFSTLFSAQEVREHLSDDQGLDRAIQWCRDTAVSHVYLETFRGGYTAREEVLRHAKKRFADAGFDVSGCVTTTKIGRDSVHGWIFPCFSDPASCDKLQSVFRYTAGLFDEIMIDDFFATRCECDQCLRSRGDRTWNEFRCPMLLDVSRRCVLEPAHQANPKVRVILKYPQWYEDFYERGYDVERQTQVFDGIWVGTETRDPDNERWGRKSQYEAYFIMRWLGTIGGPKCGGGWFDAYGTSPNTYLEQARQTVLAGAREVLLFSYGSLQRDTGPADVEALRGELRQLFQLAELIRGRPIRGLSAPKPPNSDGGSDRYVYDFLGLLGLPLVPASQVRVDVPACFLSLQAMQDPKLVEKLVSMLQAGVPLLLTDQLVARLPEPVGVALAPQAASGTASQPKAPRSWEALLARSNAEILQVPGDHWSLVRLPADRLAAIRKRMLKPFGVEFEAPTRVSLYLYGEGTAVVENFNDQPVDARLAVRPAAAPPQSVLAIPAGPAARPAGPGAVYLQLPPRSLVVVRFGR